MADPRQVIAEALADGHMDVDAELDAADAVLAALRDRYGSKFVLDQEGDEPKAWGLEMLSRHFGYGSERYRLVERSEQGTPDDRT